ncbi:MAG: ribosome maturation factor RimM [Pseudomonadales bacterium]|nr:ribosome maturation factor RimM [Pseudomonadales bacterium]
MPRSDQVSGNLIPDDLVVVGQVGGAYGVHGWLHVKSFAQPPENLLSYKPWYIQGSKVAVRALKPHGDAFVVSFGDVADRDAAQRWKGLEIAVSRSILPPTSSGEYYWHDLIGLTAVDPEGCVLGKVTSLLETGANDVLVVSNAEPGAKVSEREQLIPFIKDVVGNIDLKAGILVVDWPGIA